MSDKSNSTKVYTTPRLEVRGTVSDLTQTGQTRPGSDFKNGSVLHGQGR